MQVHFLERLNKKCNRLYQYYTILYNLVKGLTKLEEKTMNDDISEVKQSHCDLTEDTDDVGIVMREKKLVDKFIIKSGMLRFSFLLECCHPGTVPDPQLVAAMIQLVRLN